MLVTGAQGFVGCSIAERLLDQGARYFSQAFLLKLGIPHRQHFVDNKDFRLQMGRHRKRQPHVHTARITLHRRVKEFLHSAKVHDLVELRLDLAPRHPQDRPLERCFRGPSAQDETPCRLPAGSQRDRESSRGLPSAP